MVGDPFWCLDVLIINLYFSPERLLGPTGGYMKYLSIILITTFIGLTGCARERVETFSKADLKYMALLPADAHIMGAVNFGKIKNTEVYDLFVTYADHTPFESHDYQLFVDKTGFDMEKDLRSLYFAGSGFDAHSSGRGIFIATGNFSPDKISAFIQAEADEPDKILSETYNSFNIYRIQNEDLSFCFSDDQTLVGGRDALVVAALDRMNKESTIGDPLRQALSPIRFKSQAWVWMNTQNLLESLPESELSDRIKSLQAISSGQMSVAMSDELKFDGVCVCADAENAEIVQDMIKGAIATAKLGFTDDRDGVDILNKISVDQNGNEVALRFTMKRNEIEHLLKKNGFIAHFPG